MFANFLKKSEPISFLSLLLVLFILLVTFIFRTVDSPTSWSLFLYSLGVFLFVSFLVLLSDFIIQKNHITPSNYYALFTFVLLFGFFPSTFGVSKIAFSHLFILLALRRVYSLHTTKSISLKLFDSGFFIGISFLLYPLSILFLLVVYISYFLYVKIVDKRVFIPVLGFLTPLFLLYIYYLYKDNLMGFRNVVEMNINFNYQNISDKVILIPLLIVTSLVIFAIFKIFSSFQSLDKIGKQMLLLVVFNVVVAVLIILINNENIYKTIQYLFFPIAVLLGNLFSTLKKEWFKDVLLYFILVVPFVVIFFLVK